MKPPFWLLICISLLLLTRALPAQPLPDAPSAHRVADKQFWTLSLANGGATLADAITTSVLVGHTTSCPYEVWGETLYGRQPEAGRVFAVMGATYVASVASSYYLKKYNVHVWKLKLWTAPQAYNLQGHFRGAVHNLAQCR
jgi:hypothetical protein